MTKEAKFSLLVGLGFILAVGILLSDHLSATNEPTPAPLQMAGSAVRSSLGDVSDVAATPAAVVRVPRTVTLSQAVPTPGELAVRPVRRVPAVVPAIRADDVPPVAMATVPIVLAPIPPSANPDLIAAAQQHGQPVVPLTERSAEPTANRSARTPTRTVTAERGDTVATLAERAFGTNTRTTREAILSANPALRANPGRIVAGQAYNAGPARSGADAPAARPAATATVVYTVQPGDTLWSIAATQVGSTRAVPDILELNRDVIQGDRVHPRMRLRLPKSNAER